MKGNEMILESLAIYQPNELIFASKFYKEYLQGKVKEAAYKDKEKAEEIKDGCRFAFISEQYLMQTQAKKITEVTVVYELLILNVPKIIGVFDDENLAKQVGKTCENSFCIKTLKLN